MNYIGKRDTSKIDLKELIQKTKQRIYHKYLTKTKLNPMILRLLDIKICKILITSANVARVYSILGFYGLENAFDDIVILDKRCYENKYQQAFETLDLSAESCIAFDNEEREFDYPLKHNLLNKKYAFIV